MRLTLHTGNGAYDTGGGDGSRDWAAGVGVGVGGGVGTRESDPPDGLSVGGS